MENIQLMNTVNLNLITDWELNFPTKNINKECIETIHWMFKSFVEFKRKNRSNFLNVEFNQWTVVPAHNCISPIFYS